MKSAQNRWTAASERTNTVMPHSMKEVPPCTAHKHAERNEDMSQKTLPQRTVLLHYFPSAAIDTRKRRPVSVESRTEDSQFWICGISTMRSWWCAPVSRKWSSFKLWYGTLGTGCVPLSRSCLVKESCSLKIAAARKALVRPQASSFAS